MDKSMNGFRKMQQRLREEGWYVGWNLPCCQNCAWGELPYEFEDGSEVDFAKVLFNHSQDCEVEPDFRECESCDGEGWHEDTEEECSACMGEGDIKEYVDDITDCDASVDGFVCHTPEQQSESTFCFDGSKQGVKNLKAILPIIEECGCKVNWNGKGNTRPDISWELK